MRFFTSRRFLSAAAALVAATAAAPRLDARPHNGLGEYVQLLAMVEAGWGYPGRNWNELPGWYFNNTSALPFGAMGNIPALTSAGEVAGILRNLDIPYPVKPAGERRSEVDSFYGTETGSLDGRHPIARGEWQGYLFGQWNFGDFNSGRNSPVYNPETWGGLAGAQRWVDDERLVGVSVSYNFARAKLHDGGGRIDGENTRLRLYAALVPEGHPWWLAFGASGGYVSYKTLRLQADPFALLGYSTSSSSVTKASPDGYEIGLFAAFNARLRITENILFTPVARIDYNSTSIRRFTERGENFAALDVNRFNSDSVQTRLGAGLEYGADTGWFLLKTGCTVTWASELAGNDIKITSAYAGIGGKHSIYAGQLFDDAVEITPSASLVFKNGIVLEAAWSLQITFDAQFSQSVSGSVGWRF